MSKISKLIKTPVGIYRQIFKHKHEWQTRAVNRYGLTAYRVCLKCSQPQELTGEQWKNGYCKSIYANCKNIPEFDKDFI